MMHKTFMVTDLINSENLAHPQLGGTALASRTRASTRPSHILIKTEYAQTHAHTESKYIQAQMHPQTTAGRKFGII